MIIDGEEYCYVLNDKVFHCALDITMDYIGGKWKTVVLWYLRKDKKRFGELKKRIPEITEKMLSIQLKNLEKDQLIGRKVYPVVPPKVEYFLTEKGKTLIPLLEEMAKWGRSIGENKGTLQMVTEKK